MAKSLVIVESPTKASTIGRYLGPQFVVKSSVGHIRDLPVSNSMVGRRTKGSGTKPGDVLALSESALSKKQQNLVVRMGINPYHDWEAQYEVLPGKEKVVAELRAFARQVDHIYLATDLDREGEAIAWHLQATIGGDPKRYRRVLFNEITKKSIQAAFAKAGSLNLPKVEAQQARRFLDRIVGFMVSPLLWSKVGRNLSAGRVQSIAVRLLVEREREIKAFTPEEYWEVHVDLLTEQQSLLRLQVVQQEGHPFRPKTEGAARQAEDLLRTEAIYRIVACQCKPLILKAPPPFITSTLQQAASSKLHFAVQRTMFLAQKLYEAGWITYMRTDSTHVGQEAIDAVREYLSTHYGSDYLPENASQHVSREAAQEAHEAIRPVTVSQAEEHKIRAMGEEAWQLYQLIWKQFVASQMTPARFDVTVVSVQAGPFLLKAKGKVQRFPGWTTVVPLAKAAETDQILPGVVVNEELALQEVVASQHFTRASPRYSEAALVKELEKRGIGRPSTYATIISAIQERGYVSLANRRFYAEKLGEIVTDRLVESFSGLMSYNFTAQMERQLDQIAQGQVPRKAVLNEFFAGFHDALLQAERAPEQGGMRPNIPVLTTLSCPSCGRPMSIRIAKTGVFLGCSGYQSEGLHDGDRCSVTINLIRQHMRSRAMRPDGGDEAVLPEAAVSAPCVKCGTGMDTYLTSADQRLLVCGASPMCDGHWLDRTEAGLQKTPSIVIDCDQCQGSMHLQKGRFGEYMACTQCKNTRKILKNGEVAAPRERPIAFPELVCERAKDAYFVLREGAAGLFFAANNFPKSRETRSVLIAELIRFKGRLPEKWHFLTEAPAQDPEHNPTLVRFHRKTKQVYVGSRKAGKYTQFALEYHNGRWQVPNP